MVCHLTLAFLLCKQPEICQRLDGSEASDIISMLPELILATTSAKWASKPLDSHIQDQEKDWQNRRLELLM